LHRDPLQTRGVDVEPSWRGIGDFVPLENPKVISRFGVLNGIYNRALVQPAMKYRQAQAPSIKLPMKFKLVFGLLM